MDMVEVEKIVNFSKQIHFGNSLSFEQATELYHIVGDMDFDDWIQSDPIENISRYNNMVIRGKWFTNADLIGVRGKVQWEYKTDLP